MKVLAFLALLSVFLALPGCTAAQIATAEADIHAAFVEVDLLAMEGTANPEAFKAAVDKVVSLDPKNPTIVSFGTKAKAAIDNGDFTTLHTIAGGGAAITTPAPKAP